MSDVTVVKVCCRCSRTLPVTEFAKASKNKDGLECRCRQCEHERQTKRPRRSYQQNAAIHRQAASKHVKNHPEIAAAHHAVWLAVTSKKLVPVSTLLCEDCGQQAAHYHHESYAIADRLNVVALCHDCHVTRHSRYKPK